MKTDYKILLKKQHYEVLKIYNSSHSFPVHFHKKFCAGKIISGEKSLLMNGQRHLLKEGDIFFIPQYMPHLCFTEKGKSVSYIIFSALSIETVSTKMIKDDFESSEEEMEIISSLYNIAAENVKSPQGFSAMISSLVEYIDNNYNEELSVRMFTELTGWNYYHLLHVFKEKTGLSLHQYIIQTRIKKAIELYSPGKLILDLALSCGFYDQSHFIKHFRRHVGATPKNYFDSIIYPAVNLTAKRTIIS